MATESRTKNSLLNARINFIYILISVFISFFSRKIFIDCLGTEFMGLTSTLQSILGFLNLVELGIGTAISVNLFKPLADKNQDAVKEILSVMALYYKRIGLFILCCGIILSLFLPRMFEKADINIGIVYFLFYAFLFSSVISYFFTYKSTLLSADQKNYEVSKYTQISNVCKLITQMVVCYYTHNPYLWAVIEFTFGIITCIILTIRVRKIYPWFEVDRNGAKGLISKYPNVKTSMKQVFLHRIISFITGQSAPIIIYAYLSLTSVLLYTNYTTVIQKLNLFVGSILNCVDASIGNLIATKEVEAQLKVYKELTSLNFFVAGFLVFMLYYLINPFISLWLGSEYLFGQFTVILLLAGVFISKYRGSTDEFLYGYGLFKDVWAPFVEALIYLGGTVLLTPRFGLNGMIFSLTLSQYVMGGIWRPIFLFHWGFKISFLNYVKLWLQEVGLLIISYLAAMPIISFIHIDMTNYFNWLIFAIVIAIIYLTINLPLMYFFAPEFNFLFKRLRNILLK